MDWSRYQGLALLLLRLAVVFIFLWHAFGKIDPAVANQKFINMGFPGFLGPIVAWAEVILGFALLAGFMSRWVSLGLLVIILVATFGVQLPNSLEAGALGAGLERDLMVAVALIVTIAFGPGILAVDKPKSST